MRTITVTLGDQEHTIKELKSRANAAWRGKLEEPFAEVASLLESAPGTDISDGAALGGLVRSVSGLLLRSIDTVTSLLVEYAPELAGPVAEAYDSEILEAFTSVLGLAYPFGSLVKRLRGVVANVGRSNPAT